MTSNTRLIAHFLLVFGTLPVVLFFLKPHGYIYWVLWLLALLAGRALARDHGYDFKSDWNRAALTRDAISKIGLRFLPVSIALLLFTWFMIPEHLFSLPLQRPKVWVMVMLLYPLLSVFPQELLFRSYFFRHYAPWLDSPRKMILVNAASFGWMHIVLHNGVAIAFSFIASLMFAHTYHKTKSLAAVCFEHALYGCFVFTIGLGYYFYHGQAVR
jgi:uncharacterized protein